MIVHTTHDTDEEIYHHPREFAAMVKAFLAEHFQASSYSSPLPEKTIGPNNKRNGVLIVDMKLEEMTKILLEALKSAEAAHAVHEQELGRPDPDWPQWYAEHMTRTLDGAGYHLTGPSA